MAGDGYEQQCIGNRHADMATSPNRIAAASDHRGRIDDIVRRHRAGGFRLWHSGRQEGVKRHHEHAAGNGNAEQIQ